jgi:hypothetical protein
MEEVEGILQGSVFVQGWKKKKKRKRKRKMVMIMMHVPYSWVWSIGFCCCYYHEKDCVMKGEKH